MYIERKKEYRERYYNTAYIYMIMHYVAVSSYSKYMYNVKSKDLYVIAMRTFLFFLCKRYVDACTYKTCIYMYLYV